MQTKKIYQIFKVIQLERKRVSSVRDCDIPANLYISFFVLYTLEHGLKIRTYSNYFLSNFFVNNLITAIL